MLKLRKKKDNGKFIGVKKLCVFMTVTVMLSWANIWKRLLCTLFITSRRSMTYTGSLSNLLVIRQWTTTERATCAVAFAWNMLWNHYRVPWMDTTYVSLPMVRLARARHTQWKDDRLQQISREWFLELLRRFLPQPMSLKTKAGRWEHFLWFQNFLGRGDLVHFIRNRCHNYCNALTQ